MIDFETVYRSYDKELRMLSRTCYAPGMDSDDVYSEMLICLWKASVTYTEGDVEFGAYWWSIWSNRHKDILRAFYAERRPDLFVTDDLPETPFTDAAFPSANLKSWEERVVWLMLGVGCTASEVQRYVSRRAYYRIVKGWQTEDVRSALYG